jgi:hypothetical protein
LRRAVKRPSLELKIRPKQLGRYLLQEIAPTQFLKNKICNFFPNLENFKKGGFNEQTQFRQTAVNAKKLFLANVQSK